jgi:hypothetical protein
MLELVKPEEKIVGNLQVGNSQIIPVARKVIKDNNIENLNTLSIIYLFQLKPKSSKGKIILGSCKVFAAKNKLFRPYDACITIDKEFWDNCPESREALIFHELCHIYVDSDGVASIVNHDIEEFHAVLNKYGDWAGELGSNAMQLRLEIPDAV